MFANQLLVEQSSTTSRARCYGADVSPVSNKQKILAELQTLEDDTTIEEAIECLRFLAKIERGMAQLDAGQFIEHEEVKRRFGL